MRTLVVGSTSVIGQAIAARARALGEVRLAGRREADYPLDLSSGELPAVDGTFDVVVHAAADFGGPGDNDFVRAERVNAAGALVACSLARHVGAAHVLLVSSVSAGYGPEDPRFGIYALSKRHGEEAARLMCAERGIALAILRPTQVYDDSGACRRHQPLLYAMADHAWRGEDIVLNGSHDATRNYLHLDDLVEVCVRVITQSRTGLHVCPHPADVRLSEVAQAAFAAFGRGGRVRFAPEQDDLRDLPPTCAPTLYRTIDFQPAIDIREGFARMRASRERSA